MAKKKARAERTAYEIAVELAEVRAEENVLKGIDKKLSDELRVRMAAGEKQDLFYLSPVTSLKVSDTKKAFAWAEKYAPAIITLNTSAARKVFLGDALTGSMGTPEVNGFVLQTVEQLKQFKGNNDEE